MRALFLSDCLGLGRVDRLCYASPPPYSPNVVNQTVDYGGATWRGQPGGSWQQIGNTGSPSFERQADPVEQAKRINQFNIEANQPQIQGLQKIYNPDTKTGNLDEQYKAVLDSITAGEQPVVDQAIRTTNTELGKRGITGDSTFAQQQLTGAETPIRAAFQGQRTSTLQSKNADINRIAEAIAALQSGNPANSISAGLNASSTQNQANQFQQSLAEQIRQSGLDNDYRYKALTGGGSGENAYKVIGAGETLYDILNNKALFTGAYKGTGGGDDPY